jgi:hypothetical protein
VSEEDWAKSSLLCYLNLITLCDTCHRGLDPHYEWSLYSLLEDIDPNADTKSRERRKYLEGVQAYRVTTQRFLKQLGAKDVTQ